MIRVLVMLVGLFVLAVTVEAEEWESGYTDPTAQEEFGERWEFYTKPGGTDITTFTLGDPEPYQPEDEVFSLTEANGSKEILTIAADGTVVLGEGVTLDEASTKFWEMVGTKAPCAAKD